MVLGSAMDLMQPLLVLLFYLCLCIVRHKKFFGSTFVYRVFFLHNLATLNKKKSKSTILLEMIFFYYVGTINDLRYI